MENNKDLASKFKFTSTKIKKAEKVEERKEVDTYNIAELKKYFFYFTTAYKSINILILAIKNDISNLDEKQFSKEELSEKIEIITTELKNLKENFLNNANFLINNDKYRYMSNLEELHSLLEEKKEIVNPRPKFSFSNKSKVAKKTNEIFSPNEIKNIILSEDESLDYILKDKSDCLITVTNEEINEKNNLILENLKNCEVRILHFFKAFYLKNIQNCTILIGSVGGGSHITNVLDSFVYLATHQLRIHDSFRTNFNIITSSNPIIENSSELKFSPLNLDYPERDENLSVIH